MAIEGKRWAANVRKVTPYVPGDQPKGANIIKLNTNENPYPPSPEVEKMQRSTDVSKFALYPELSARSLTDALADYHGLAADEVFVGVGSDDVLANIFLTFFNSKKPILFPDITYSFYPVWADIFRIPFRCPPLREDFTIDGEDYKGENGGVVIANPNAPTSLLMPLKEIESIIQANPDVVVVVDEAYVDFGGETALPLIHKYDNVLVVRTYSKSRSMAGMRIGYAMGDAALIQAMTDVKESINSYTINTESILLGVASLKDEAYFQEKIKQVITTRKWTADKLENLGFEVKPSCTNFLFVSHERVSAEKLYNQLKKKEIYVRHFSAQRISNYLRITIGTDEQMECLLKAVEEILQSF